MASPDPSTEVGGVLSSLVPLGGSGSAIAQANADVNASTFPGISPLTAAIYFSRKFAPTYYVVCMLAVFAGSWKYRRTRRSQRKQLRRLRDAEKPDSQASSSASSTLVGSGVPTPKTGSVSERTSLLTPNSKPPKGASFASRLYYRLLASLMYQPKPIPAVTARSNHLPDNGTSAVVVIIFLVNLFYLLYGLLFSSSVGFAFTFAERAGLCFVANLPVLYMLGAKNNQPLKWLTGWTYEKLNLYHRRLGEWMILLGICHFTGMMITYVGLFKPLGYSWGWFLSLKVNILGITALSSFLTLWVTSIGYVREKAYEFFLVSHIALQVIALVVLFLHHYAGRPYVLLASIIWAVDRGVSRILRSNKKFVATLEVGADKETVLVYCDILIDRSQRGNISSGWKAGQHVFLSVPGIKWYHAFQSHPFTIGSPAPTPQADGTICQMQLIIRAMDGFSKELLEYAKFHQHAEITLDGPYGDSDLAESLLSADRVCLVAGGSGITLTYPLAWILWTKDRITPVVSSRSVYHQGKKIKTEVCLHSAVPEDKQAHFWVRQISEHSSWITTFPEHHTGILPATETAERRNGVDLVSKTFETRNAGGHRPDIATEMRVWLKNGDQSIFGRRQRVCFVVCGPDGLVRDVRNCAAALVQAGYNVELHVEKFGW